MVERLFRMGFSREKALARLGAAVLLHWADFSPIFQEGIVQEAMTLADDDKEVQSVIESLISNARFS